MDGKSILCKKKFKYIKKIAGILGILFIFCTITNALNYIYVPDDNFTRILWHQFYEDKGKIDNLYIGSSHVYQGINPEQLDSINGKYNFNLAAGGQQLDGAYYLLKEADKYNSLSHVYLELYYMYSTKDNFNEDQETMDLYYYLNWKNTDYMKWSCNKIKYMLSILGPEKYIDTFLPFSRQRGNLNNWDYIKQVVGNKQTEDYMAYEFHDESVEYRKKGHQYYYKEYSDEERVCSQARIFGKEPIGEKSEEYLRKFISYCQKRDIPVTLFVSPMDELRIISTEHYDNYVDQVKEIAAEYDVPFYDFNLAKEEYLPIHQGKYFTDNQHLNGAGASLFTSFFSEVVSGSPLENEKYFYASYEEKLQNTAPAVYGLYYRDSEGLRAYHVASNRDKGMEYRITIMRVQNESGGGIGAVSDTGLFGKQRIYSFQG